MIRTYALTSLMACTLLTAGCDKGKPAPTATANTETLAPTDPGAPTATRRTATTYGAGLKAAAPVSVDEILSDPKSYAGKTVRVEGMITDVCPKRGCWLEMAGKRPGQKLRFKVRDGEMVFPMTAKGKYAVTEGVVALRELTLEKSKEYAAYQAREYGKDVDPATITEPTTIVRIDGTGAEIRDRD